MNELDIKAVQASYARWAPIYDRTFGAVTNAGRRRAVSHINARSGRVLEVGVGTGLSLPHYKADLMVTGIDFSEEMLRKAREKVQQLNLRQVVQLHRMDAREMDFPDNHFDSVAAMHVLSVVPEPEKVMSEIVRVCKLGGEVVITNHFMRENGVLAALERHSARFANLIGWHSDFEIGTILQEKDLSVEERKSLPPFGMMTFLVLHKSETA